MDWKARVRAAFAEGGAADDDIVEELAQHAADAYQAARADGHHEASARRLVDAQIASWTANPARLHRHRPTPAPVAPPVAGASRATGLLQDVRYALRLLVRQPGHSAAAVLTIALGIGATTAILSVVHGVMLKPLPWPAADRIVRLSETRSGGTNRSRFGPILTNATYHAWRDDPKTLEHLAGWYVAPLTIEGTGDAVRIPVGSVSAAAFPLLGARPALGTLFAEADEAPGAEAVVVLSHGLWRERFGSSRAALGRVVRLDGRPHRVVAVMPPSFVFPDRETRAWVPLFVPPVSDGTSQGQRLSMFRAIGRLRPGVTPAQAAAEGTARARHGESLGLVAIAVFGSKEPPDVAVVPYLQAETEEVRPAILVFLVAVCLLLVTATANVASLQLARATGRRREIAIRTALGASTARVARQLLIESTILSLGGGAAGLALAAAANRALPWLLPAGFPRLDDIALDAPVLAAAFAISIASGIAFGLAPAGYAMGVNLVGSLSEAGEGTWWAGRARRALGARRVIIASQVAVASLLLLGGLLLGRSFMGLVHADRGFDPGNLLTATLPLPDASYTGPRRAAATGRILERVRALPGVTSAAVAVTLPLTPGEILGGFTMPDPRGGGTVTVRAAIRPVSPGYFSAMRIRLVAGRAFTDADSPTSQPVVIVNRSFAAKYLESPAIGRKLPSGLVVGIVDDVHQRGVTDATLPELYQCSPQLADGLTGDNPRIVIRTTSDPLRVVPALRAIVRKEDPTVALDDVSTMEDRVNADLARPRLYAVLLASFGLFALTIAGVGLFGLLSYSVAQRTREIGVRTALGARPRDVVRLVMRQGLTLALVGVAVGLAASFAVVRYLSSLLYGITAFDPWSYAGVAAVLVTVSVVACGIPANRAARTDPLRALRQS